MLKLKYDHVIALEHAALYILQEIDRQTGQRSRRSLEDDIERLKELQKHVLFILYNQNTLFTAKDA